MAIVCSSSMTFSASTVALLLAMLAATVTSAPAALATANDNDLDLVLAEALDDPQVMAELAKWNAVPVIDENNDIETDEMALHDLRRLPHGDALPRPRPPASAARSRHAHHTQKRSKLINSLSLTNNIDVLREKLYAEIMRRNALRNANQVANANSNLAALG